MVSLIYERKGTLMKSCQNILIFFQVCLSWQSTLSSESKKRLGNEGIELLRNVCPLEMSYCMKFCQSTWSSCRRTRSVSLGPIRPDEMWWWACEVTKGRWQLSLAEEGKHIGQVAGTVICFLTSKSLCFSSTVSSYWKFCFSNKLGILMFKNKSLLTCQIERLGSWMATAQFCQCVAVLYLAVFRSVCGECVVAVAKAAWAFEWSHVVRFLSTIRSVGLQSSCNNSLLICSLEV